MSEFSGIKFVRRMFGCKDRVVPDGRTLGEVVADLIESAFGKKAVVWDAFSGSAYCGMVFKRRGMGVVSSDIRSSSWIRATSLVGANSASISTDKVEELAKATPRAEGWFSMEESPLIGRQNAAWMDAITEALTSLGEGERMAIVLGIIWTIETLLQRGSRFLHMKRSWHRKTLCGGWHMRDKDLAAEWRRFMIEDYPNLVHDNSRDNPCHLHDAIGLAPAIMADAAYFDPPYTGLFSSYKGNYDLVDDWPGILLGSAMPPEPSGKPHLRFSSPDNAIASYSMLMEGSKHIPLWIISYSDSDTMRVTPEDIACLAETNGRSVDILRFPFRQSVNKRHAIPKTCNECLIICKAGTLDGTKIVRPTSNEIVCDGTDDEDGDSIAVNDAGPTCASLFSGIGGTDLALGMAGFRCVFACEKDGLARKAYEANFGHVPHPDVRKLNPEDIPPHDLLSAGWPCQPTSICGKHKGMDDERCRLSLEIIRIAEVTRPKAILLENSNTLPTHDDGALLKDLLSKFGKIGYRGFWRILEAGDFGMPTQRKRTYVALFRDDLGIQDFDWPKPSGSEKSSLRDVLLPDRETAHLVQHRPDIFIDQEAVEKAEHESPQETIRVGRIGMDEEAKQGYRVYSPAGHSATICSGGGGMGAKSGLYLINGKVRTLHAREAARALGFPDSFLLPTSENNALKLVGNSVAIPVVAMIAREIAKKLGFGVGAGTGRKRGAWDNEVECDVDLGVCGSNQNDGKSTTELEIN